MAKPELLILDEPCAGLDPVARERFLNWLDRLGQSSSRPALVLVTHHVEEIMPAFSHVLMLKDGAVAATGRMKETLTSANLSKTFATRIRLQRKQGRYTLVLPRDAF